MTPPPHQPAQQVRPPQMLRSLTRRRVEGENAGALYTRPPEVTNKIREALVLSPADLGRRLNDAGYGRTDGAHRKAPSYLPPEALVYLVRHHTSEAERLQASHPDEALAHALAAGRASSAALNEMVSVAARQFRDLPETALERAQGRLLEWFLTLLPDTSSRGDELEVFFGLAVKKRAISFAARSRRKGRDASSRTLDLAADLDFVSSSDGPDEDAVRSDRDRRLWAAIEALPDSHRIPFLRYTVDDIPVQSKDPETHTLVAELGLSHTTIYTRIHEAEKRLRIALHDSDDPTSS